MAVRAPDVDIEVVESAVQRDQFVHAGISPYARDLKFVPPIRAERREFIDPARNPYFQHARGRFFLARRGGRVVGRIAAVHDRRYNAFHETQDGFFGFFESEDDVGVAAALLEDAASWLRSLGLTRLIGPLNFSFHHDCGLLVQGFDAPPSMMMPYNPPWYERLLLACGLSPWHDLYSYGMSTDALPEPVYRLARRVERRGEVRIRSLNFSDADAEARRIREVYDDMLVRGWGFAPLSDAEFFGAVQRIKPLLLFRPEMCLVAESRGTPVAFSITVPDTNEAQRAAGGSLSRFGIPIGLVRMLWKARETDRLRVLLFGIRPGFRRRGIDALLADETARQARRLGYVSGELGWIRDDDRLLNRAVHALGAQPIKTYRLFQKPLAKTPLARGAGRSLSAMS